MDRETQAKEMKSLGSTPDWAIGSVHAVTEDGQILVASATGSQLPAYAYGATNVLWVVGGQKIVRNLEEGLKELSAWYFGYLFLSDLKKILITYGSSSEEEIKSQLASITNFASLH